MLVTKIWSITVKFSCVGITFQGISDNYTDRQKGIKEKFVTCRQSQWAWKFYSKPYESFEFDDLVAIADADHANFIFNLDVTIDGNDIENITKDDLGAPVKEIFFRYYLK